MVPCRSSYLALFSLAVTEGLQPVSLSRRSDGSTMFVDNTGRERIFHGTNAIVKGPPWLPDSSTFSSDISMAKEDFQWMQKLGLNVLRLGVMWPGVEPFRGQYNETYLDELAKIVELAADHGVYTLLDGHQDGLSEYFCGEGIPFWAVKHAENKWYDPLSKPFPAPFDAMDPRLDLYTETKLAGDPTIPTRKACHNKNLGPGHMEITMESAQAYQALWDNWNNIGDAWASMWAKVAARFKGCPAILGIELMNEPFAGDLYHNPLMMAPWPDPLNADHINLQPTYDRVAKEVRKVDESLLIFFAGVTWADFGSGFQHPPGGRDYANRSVLAYHYYEGPQVNIDLQFDSYTRNAKRLGVASFLTETSMPGTRGAEKFSMPWGVGDSADSHLQSWAGFQWKSFFREAVGPEPQVSQLAEFGAAKTGTSAKWLGGAPSQAIQHASARTYAPVVAGVIHSMYFNVTSGFFELQYDCHMHCSKTTEIYVWPNRYPGGFAVDAVLTKGAGEIHTSTCEWEGKIEVSVIGASTARIVVKVSAKLRDEQVLV